MKGSCHCGAVSIEVPDRPEYLNQCNCTACWKLGTLWGYYPGDAVRIGGGPRSYARVDVPQPTITFDFCDGCGATIQWAPVPGNASPRRGINMRLFDPGELRGIEVRYGDRRNHDAVEPRHYARQATMFDDGGPVA